MPDLRLALAQRITSRDGTLTKDSAMYNMYREENDGKLEAVKRPGVNLYQTMTGPFVAQGIFAIGGASYSISGNVIRRIDFATTFGIPAAAGTAPYDIVTDITFGLLTIAVLKNTSGMWYFDGTTVTQVTDIDYPAATVRGVVLLDGTYYVMDTAGVIYGSAINDPTVWTALNFIRTDQSLGRPRRLYRHLNYCFAFSDFGLQAYYDAANAAPGTPLGPVGNASYLIGCATGDSLVSLDDLTIFMSKPKQRGRSISALQGLSLVNISTPFVDKILNRSSLVGVQAFGLKVDGHSFYILNLTDLNLSLVCDLVSKDWALWTSTVAGVEGYFQYSAYLTNGTATFDYLQHATTGSIYYASTTFLQDELNAITCRIRTIPYDGQTTLNKFFNSLDLIGNTVASTVSLRKSDDDYQTWSAYRTVDMSTVRKQLRGNGRSRRRAFELLHTAATALRLEAMEFEVYLGNS